MKIKLLLISAMVVLAGCTPTPSAKQFTPEVVPDGLTDCKFYSITDNKGSTMRIVRCPNSSTSVNWQSKRQLTTVDN